MHSSRNVSEAHRLLESYNRLIENFLVYTHTEMLMTDSLHIDTLQNNYVVYPKSSIEHSASQKAQQSDRMRDLDVRLQAIETYTTSANSRLAREIEELR